MDRKKLGKLRAQHAHLSKLRVVKTAELAGLAGALGRRLKGGVGKHPMYVNEFFPELAALSIPSHGTDTGRRLAASILNQLEEDFTEWDITLEDEGLSNG
jgi:hypothetical protein